MWVGRSSSERKPKRAVPDWVPEPVIDPDIIPEASHGGVSPERSTEGLIDLSLSTNPFGPPPYLESALEDARAEATRYPDRPQKDLAEQIGSRLGLDPEEVIVGGSASELLRAAITAFGMGRSVLLPRFTYEEYNRVAMLARARVGRVPMPGFAFSVLAATKMIREESMVVLPNPGTPFGHCLGKRELQALVEAAEERHAIVLVDESYLPFVEDGESAAGLSPSVVTVFSWSKVLGTPGMPFGHATGHPAVLRGIRTQLLPWSVGAVGRHLALRTLENEKWVRESLEKTRRLSAEVRKRLHATTQANYFAVESVSARKLTQDLRTRGFAVRDLTPLGLPRHVRFGLRDRETTFRFLDVLKSLTRRLKAE